jgi:hypothetical protein
LIVGYLVFGRGHSDQAGAGEGKDTVGDHTKVAPSESVETPAPNTVAAPSTTIATGSLPSSATIPGLDTAPRRQITLFRHLTVSGVRWTLRRVSISSMLLVVDLGDGQVANVSVLPAFEQLDLAGMIDRLDRLRSVIGQQFSLQTANYSFDRDGIVRHLP